MWRLTLGDVSIRQPRRLTGNARGGTTAARLEIAAVRPRPVFTHATELEPTRQLGYQAVLHAYVLAAASRARAIYRVGHLRADGLSDLDLVFVPGEPEWDDGQFYSARVRLPHARRLFPHDARPLPFEARGAIRFTSHANRRLVFGEDVLADQLAAVGPEQDWSLLLEGYLKYERFLASCARTGLVRAERVVSKATSLAYSLALFDRVSGEISAPGYAVASLALREQIARRPSCRERLLAELWDLFVASFTALERDLAKRLPCSPGETLAAFARAFLRGERTLAGLDPVRLGERRSAIASYHGELARRGFFLGSLFAKGAYGAGATRERASAHARRALGKLVAAGYRLGALG